jgi:hypothetical protein
MQFFTGEWLKDPALSLCTPATRGIWMDLICAMHENGRLGQLRGTVEQLARVARCSTAELAQALTDLQSTCAADVADRNGVFTVVNRRMSRQSRKRQTDATRQFRKRHSESHADVTPRHQPPSRGRSQKSEDRIISPPSPKPDDQPFTEVEGEDVFDSDGDEWHGIEQSLRSSGVMDSSRCIAKARENGCSPADVGLLIGHFEAHPKGWTANFLHARVMRAMPGDDPSKGWPEPSVEWKKLKEATLPPKALTPSRAQLIEQDRQLRAGLEATFGAVVDGMGVDELRAAVNGNAILTSRIQRALAKGESPNTDFAVREHVLHLLSERAANGA